MSDLPIVCTLGPEALAARRQGLLASLMHRAERHEELASGHRLSFAARDDALAFIAKTVAAERHCCQFLRFQMLWLLSGSLRREQFLDQGDNPPSDCFVCRSEVFTQRRHLIPPLQLPAWRRQR